MPEPDTTARSEDSPSSDIPESDEIDEAQQGRQGESDWSQEEPSDDLLSEEAKRHLA